MNVDSSSLSQSEHLRSKGHHNRFSPKSTIPNALTPSSSVLANVAADSHIPSANCPPASNNSTVSALFVGKDNQELRSNSVNPILSSSSQSPCLDPLSNQIYLRTNSNPELSIAHQLLNAGRPNSPNPDSPSRPSHDSTHVLHSDGTRERKKGPSFLTRLSRRGPFKKDKNDIDSDSEFGDAYRTDGTDAIAPTTVIGVCGGYQPLYKEPPRYIRVKSHYKNSRNLNRLFLAQELSTEREHEDGESLKYTPATVVGSRILKGGDAIWAAEFSLDGHYLAAAGMDNIVRIYAVLSTIQERKSYEEEQEAEHAKGSRVKRERLSAPVFRSKPIRQFQGHTGEVLALSWSKNNFLLSSSMDKTVKLWHLSRQESLCTFQHQDLVTSIAFHPVDDRFFLAGSLDEQLRLWSIPDNSVAFSAATGGFITAVAFSPNGKTAICGLLSGLCIFYETEGLKNPWQIHVRSSRGKNAKGSKITGIHTTSVATPASLQGDVRVLISSNDSRVRIYNLRTRMLEAKFKGHENLSSQIHARFSDDGQFVTSGSEDRKAYIWDVPPPELDSREKQPYEYFDAHPEVVTVALMAPTATKQLLGASGDPIYDLCNPPPVKLASLGETITSQSVLRDSAHSDVPANMKKQNESPAFIERSKHKDGNIMITTDRKGVIKVFRQDCAALKRNQSLWETGSKFSGKVSGIGRSPSLVTKTSVGSHAHSRRGSLSTIGINPVKGQGTLDRIMSWRQDIESGHNSVGNQKTQSDRSISPPKSGIPTPHNTSASNLASEARRQPYIGTLSSSQKGSINLPDRERGYVSNVESAQQLPAKGPEQGRSPTVPPTPSFSLVNATNPDGQGDGRDSKFWNLSRWRESISGFRNVAASALPGDKGSEATHSRKNSNLTIRSGQGQRRSLGVSDLRRLIASGDEGSQRRFVQPTAASMTSTTSDAGSEITSPTVSHHAVEQGGIGQALQRASRPEQSQFRGRTAERFIE